MKGCRAGFRWSRPRGMRLGLVLGFSAGERARALWLLGSLCRLFVRLQTMLGLGGVWPAAAAKT